MAQSSPDHDSLERIHPDEPEGADLRLVSAIPHLILNGSRVPVGGPHSESHFGRGGDASARGVPGRE